MSNLAAMTPVEIDTELSKLWGELNKVHTVLLSLQASQRKFEQGSWGFGDRSDEIAKAEDAAAALIEKAMPFEDEFGARGGWNRYFLVTNTNGHVHRGMNCSTCFPTTQYAWLIELADCDEDAMVEEWGEMACTVCFPSAPAHPRFSQPSKRDLAAKAERDAEKAAKAAAKAEKALPGGELRVGYDTLRTKVAARNALSKAVQDFCWLGDTKFIEQARTIAAALEGTEIDIAQVVERAAKKAAKDGMPHSFPGLAA